MIHPAAVSSTSSIGGDRKRRRPTSGGDRGGVGGILFLGGCRNRRESLASSSSSSGAGRHQCHLEPLSLSLPVSSGPAATAPVVDNILLASATFAEDDNIHRCNLSRRRRISSSETSSAIRPLRSSLSTIIVMVVVAVVSTTFLARRTCVDAFSASPSVFSSSSSSRALPILKRQLLKQISVVSPSSSLPTQTILAALDSRQLRFIGDYAKKDEESSARSSSSSMFPFSVDNGDGGEDEKQTKYTEFIRQYVSGNSFWSSVMSGSMTNQGILSQAVTVRQLQQHEITKETVMAVAASSSSSSSQKIWKQQLSSTATTTTVSSRRFVSTMTSSSSSSPKNQQLKDGGDEQQDTATNKVIKTSISSVFVDDYPYEPKRGYGPYIYLSPEERELFHILRKAREEMNLTTTLRVAGGWVRDKLLATPEFARSRASVYGSTSATTSDGIQRLTSKYKQPATVAVSMGRQGGKVIGGGSSSSSVKASQQKKKNRRSKNGSDDDDKSPSSVTIECQPPVDIDIALDDMLGREYAEHLNDYLGQIGEKTHGVGVILQNPEKSKHLETATMKVGTFWIDFVNLRAEEYTQDSRIPELMRIGTPAEDAFRRDLTINSLFYNVNNGQIEDWTGRGFDDLRRGVVSTPLAPLTTLLDDPLRALRSVRFAARLRFTMDDSLVDAARDDRVRQALAEKVSRERVGCEVDLMLRSPDPVGAIRLLINLNLAQTVFPFEKLLTKEMEKNALKAGTIDYDELFQRGLDLLLTNYEHLEECKMFPPVWCQSTSSQEYSVAVESPDLTLCEDDETRRYLWYASFLKPLYNFVSKIPEDQKNKLEGKKANRSVVTKLLVDELKRPTREAEAVEKIIKGAQQFKSLINSGCDLSAVSVLLSDIQVKQVRNHSDEGSPDEYRERDPAETPKTFVCTMNDENVTCATENDPVWKHAMSFRLKCSKILRKVGPLWRAALFLALSEHISDALEGQLEYVIEGDVFDETQEDAKQREIDRYDAFATAMQRLGLVGIWDERPILDGGQVKKILPNIPKGPAFREVMDEQEEWTTLHPGAGTQVLAEHLQERFPEYL